MYRILICDDDQNYIDELREILEECNAGERELEFIAFDSGEALLEHLPEDSDALFLDIRLGGMDGNQTAVELAKLGYQGLLILCSGIFKPTPETIKISPYRYLLKQADRETTCREIQEIFQEMDRQKACFTLEASYQRKKVIIRTMDIVYVTHHKKGSILHLNQKCREEYSEAKLITHYDFQELLEKLHSVGFVCPHNSYLVNLRYVSMFDPDKEFIELDGNMLAVARGKVCEFSKEFADYVNQKYKEKWP